jgi:cell division protein FtsL
MTRLNLLLLAAVMLSGLFLVQTAYEARRLFTAIDRAKNEEHQLDTEFKRLDAERQAQATNLRVDKVARDRLHMRTASPAVTQYVVDGAASAAGSAAAPASTSVSPSLSPSATGGAR